MALISAKTIVTSLSLFHITLGFFFLTSPITVADQALVFILGESMGMVRALPPNVQELRVGQQSLLTICFLSPSSPTIAPLSRSRHPSLSWPWSLRSGA